MLSEGDYVLKKEVDWSLLNEGLTIPIDNQVIFARNMGGFLARGERKEIKIWLNGKEYKAIITNVKFDENKYKRRDVIQMRYSPSSEIAVALKSLYRSSYKYFLEQRAIKEKTKGSSQIKLPEDQKEYLAIYTTQYEDTYVFETISNVELEIAREFIIKEKEEVYEASLNLTMEDKSAEILLDERLVKIRKLSRAIGDNLKEVYGYRCQICGENIGSRYDAHIVEAHHIDYFVTSLNNDASNQLIVCPNHHSIIHKVNPQFIRDEKLFSYPNGLKEKLELNVHL